jgi:F-type H+-transporting ATPase subunit b
VLIDWFTVGAQVVNFLILVGLLKHFLYGPILRAMDRREERIAARFDEADQKLKEAEAREQEFRQLQQELERARGDRLRKIEEEAEGRRKELLTSAKEEANDLRDSWLDSLRKEREDFFNELKKRVGIQVLHVARKSLLDLTDETLEQRLIHRFVKRFGELRGKEREQMLAAARNRGLQVRSSFAWPEEMRRDFLGKLGEPFGQGVEVQFTTDANMALGIEMAVGGLKLPWGVDDYFAELKQAVAELYDARVNEAETPEESFAGTPREEKP